MRTFFIRKLAQSLAALSIKRGFHISTWEARLHESPALLTFALTASSTSLHSDWSNIPSTVKSRKFLPSKGTWIFLYAEPSPESSTVKERGRSFRW